MQADAEAPPERAREGEWRRVSDGVGDDHRHRLQRRADLLLPWMLAVPLPVLALIALFRHHHPAPSAIVAGTAWPHEGWREGGEGSRAGSYDGGMITATWSPTHLLRWTPRDGSERTWLVHVTRIEVASHPWWLAQTADEHRRSAAPHWRYEAAADLWTWRGLAGFEGGIGAVRCEALDFAPALDSAPPRDAAMPRGWRP